MPRAAAAQESQRVDGRQFFCVASRCVAQRRRLLNGIKHRNGYVAAEAQPAALHSIFPALLRDYALR